MRLGFGCSGAWGMRWFSEEKARGILLSAFERGVRFVDTAGFYADGEAERRLGRALGEFREPVFVSTKTGTRYARGRAVKDFSEAAIRADVAASLSRLGRKRIDLLLLHGPTRPELQSARGLMADLAREGKIARWGVCGAGAGLSDALDAGAEAVMGVYNFIHPGHRAIFGRARAAGALVISIAPLAQGLYRRGFFSGRGPADLWRIARALVRNRAELALALKARPVLEGIDGFTPAQAALAFALSCPEIDVAVTTSTDPDRLAESLDAAGRALPGAALASLGAFAP